MPASTEKGYQNEYHEKSMFDLTENYPMIEKIVRSKFSGYDVEAEDLIQEVCYKIHRQNMGERCYDPAKGSESRYVYMVAESVVRKVWRKSQNDPVASASDLDTEYQERAVDASHFDRVFLNTLEDRLKEESPALADVFEMMVQGYSRREMASLSEYSEYRIRQEREKLQAFISKEIN